MNKPAVSPKVSSNAILGRSMIMLLIASEDPDGNNCIDHEVVFQRRIDPKLALEESDIPDPTIVGQYAIDADDELWGMDNRHLKE